jgi:hypothetical protein
MRTTLRNLRSALAAAAMLAGLAPAQSAGLRVDALLAADAERNGPAGWTFVREYLLPQLVSDPSGVPPIGDALRVRVDDQGNLDVQPDVLGEDLGAAYARIRLFVDGEVCAQGTCAFDGTERWELDAPIEPMPPLLGRLIALVGPSARHGWLEVDVSTAVGNLMTAATAADALSEAMTLGAFECGMLGLFSRTTSGGRLRVVGKSDGGLTLPAVFAALAVHQGGPGPSGPGASERDDLERWLVLAASAHAAERDEALRQLSRFDDRKAREALTHNLLDDGPARTIAVHGLARDRHALDPLLRAAERGDPLAADVAKDLLPDAVQSVMAAHPAPLGETTGNPTEPPTAPIGLAAALLAGILAGACLGLALRTQAGPR